MKKSILEIAKPLTRDQQSKIKGGDMITALRCNANWTVCWQEEVDSNTTATFTVVDRDGTEYVYIL